MARDDRDFQEMPAERAQRRERTDRLGAGGTAGEPINPQWRGARTTGRGRTAQSFPSSGQEFALWLQYGGWRFLLGAVLLVVIVALLIIMTSQPADQGVGLDVPTLEPVRESVRVQTPLPTVTPSAATPIPAPAAQGAIFRVTGTGSEGLFLRSAASGDAQVIKTLPEGTEVTIIGEDVVQPDRVWKKVRDPQGAEGYAASDWLKQVGP